MFSYASSYVLYVMWVLFIHMHNTFYLLTIYLYYIRKYYVIYLLHYNILSFRILNMNWVTLFSLSSFYIQFGKLSLNHNFWNKLNYMSLFMVPVDTIVRDTTFQSRSSTSSLAWPYSFLQYLLQCVTYNNHSLFNYHDLKTFIFTITSKLPSFTTEGKYKFINQ